MAGTDGVYGIDSGLVDIETTRYCELRQLFIAQFSADPKAAAAWITEIDKKYSGLIGGVRFAWQCFIDSEFRARYDAACQVLFI